MPQLPTLYFHTSCGKEGLDAMKRPCATLMIAPSQVDLNHKVAYIWGCLRAGAPI
ncbi:predicted protein [Sclerotinia sclerotiorum 1980 UF-70]|uniref:Uncharacterized protein n=1 Tax=Sclerotinia sclerotiorum (strain ATCC 18683 / 1980 / Ss-1) TaxID=665079 RepID=A7EWE4_SCLS1|nr:predicted protein [Sclerotinia sclerotiorum 1980 UF-70]EDN93786.1 predicted protein [Sclerotinia sclerotiorum 1980 UF-70]